MRPVLNCNPQAMPEPPVPKSRPNKESVSPPIVCSRDLLGDRRELIIQHGRDRYRLLLTRSNKLILTK
jgi:hemin uptake protein HemP